MQPKEVSASSTALSRAKGVTVDWENWSRSLWKEAEDSWITRTGQDHFYRRAVVLPAIMNELSSIPRIKSIVDLGCGDGYFTEMVISGIEKTIGSLELGLIDLSSKQLDVAKKRFHHFKPITASTNLSSDDWGNALQNLSSPRLLISIFVLQEMVTLKPFLNSLSNLMGKEDLALLVTVAPRFAYLMTLEHRKMGRQVPSKKSGLDWKWAAKYPIPMNDRTIYLPHFQRTLDDYARLVRESKLVLQGARYLKVPGGQESIETFEQTEYAKQITKECSSVLLVVKKNAKNGTQNKQLGE